MSTVTCKQKEMNVDMWYEQDTANWIKVDNQIVECTVWATKIDENNQSFTCKCKKRIYCNAKYNGCNSVSPLTCWTYFKLHFPIICQMLVLHSPWLVLMSIIKIAIFNGVYK